MLTESRSEDGASRSTDTRPLWWRVLSTLIIMLLAIFALGWTSRHFAPLNVDNSLVPVFEDGSRAMNINITGWPLAGSASYWLESSRPDSGYKAVSYNFLSLAVDILFFYGLIRLIIFMLQRTLHPVILRYDSHRYIDRYARYVVLAAVALLISYYIVTIYVEYSNLPPLITDMPLDGALEQVHDGGYSD